jgi:hypothetical protein
MHPVAEALVAYFDRAGRRPIVVASHPRSGTHLLIDSLRLNFPACRSWKRRGESLHRLYLHLDELARLGPAEAVALASRCERPVLKTHALGDFSAASLTPGPCPCDPDVVAWLRANAAGFLYVYRDPRDVMKSLHAFNRESGAAAGVSLGAFIRQREHGLTRPALWARHVTGWVADASVHCVAMETLLRRPDVALSGIAERLGLAPDACGKAGGAACDWRLPPKPRTLLRMRFARLFARHPASTAIGPGLTVERPWESLLTREDRQFFRDEIGDLLIKLGYEESDDWIDPANDGQIKYPAGFWNGPAVRAGAATLPTEQPARAHAWRGGAAAGSAASAARRLGVQQ